VSRSAELRAKAPASGESRQGGLARFAADERGATAVEFSLVIGLIVVLLLGILQVGMALMQRNQISHALSQTVREIHLRPELTRPQIEAHLRGLLAGDATLDVCVEPIDGTSVARIVVLAPYEFRLPFVPIGTVQVRLETIAPRITNDPADTTNNCAEA
jgi:Flp pilus assembly pilin Flp